MSPTFPASPRSVSPYANHIEFVAASSLAIAWCAWLLIVVVILLCAVALPLWLRISVCAGMVGINVACIERFILLRGPRAVRALEWTDAGVLTAYLGPTRAPVSAELSRGSFRLCPWLLVLRLGTARGGRQLLVDGRVQQHAAFRRLCRTLSLRMRTASRRSEEAS